MRRHAWLWLPALVAFLAGVVGIGVAATDGGQAAVDEPQYLLTAVSIFEDRDVDISDELTAERWRAYHSDPLPRQTEPLADGSRLSPHDPLLPLLIAVPTGLFGWVGAKVALSLLAAGGAALLAWTAARRFAVPTTVAGIGSALAFASPPLAVYAQQIYPELPAGIATLAAVAAMTTPGLRRRHVGWAVLMIVALPWLGAKYIPVAAALAVLLGVVVQRRAGWSWLLGTAAALAAAGVAYVGLHQAIWGGWTVYAAGDHFQQTGEFSVVGVDPDYAGRSLRVIGLLIDRHYGLATWQPAWLLLVPAVVALVVRRPRPDALGWLCLLVPLAAGWATATWLALTAHGFWWPGRQTVVVLPLAAVAVLWLVSHPLPRLRWPAAGLAGAGVLGMVALLWQGSAGRLEWVVDHTDALAPAYRLLRPVLPDYANDGFMPAHLLWVLVVISLAIATGWRLRRSHDLSRRPHQPERQDPCHASV